MKGSRCRPLSSTSPVVILQNGTFWGTFGGSGGSRIFGSVAQVLLNLEAGLNLSAAIEKPRYHNQISPNVTTIEVGAKAPKAVMEGLRARGHEVGEFDINLGAAEGESECQDPAPAGPRVEGTSCEGCCADAVSPRDHLPEWHAVGEQRFKEEWYSWWILILHFYRAPQPDGECACIIESLPSILY